MMRNSIQRGAEASSSISGLPERTVDYGLELDRGLAADRAIRQQAQAVTIERLEKRLNSIDQRIGRIEKVKESALGDTLTSIAIVGYLLSPVAYAIRQVDRDAVVWLLVSVLVGCFGNITLPWLFDLTIDRLCARRSKVACKLHLEKDRKI